MDRKIVRLRPEHTEALADFYLAIAADANTVKKFHPHPFDRETAMKITTHSGDLYVGMFEEETMVAYGMLRYTDQYPDPSLGIAVRPDHQNKGLGSEMMDYLITSARMEGIPFITLFVYKWNPSHHLYVRKGFVLEQSKRDPEEYKGILRL